MAGFLQGLGQFVDRIPAYMFPGLGQPGVDPGMVQQARGQALMQMGAGIASGQDVAKAYGLGQAAGYEPIEQWRRQEMLRVAAEERAKDDAFREWQKTRAISADERQSRLDEAAMSDRIGDRMNRREQLQLQKDRFEWEKQHSGDLTPYQSEALRLQKEALQKEEKRASTLRDLIEKQNKYLQKKGAQRGDAEWQIYQDAIDNLSGRAVDRSYDPTLASGMPADDPVAAALKRLEQGDVRRPPTAATKPAAAPAPVATASMAPSAPARIELPSWAYTSTQDINAGIGRGLGQAMTADDSYTSRLNQRIAAAAQGISWEEWRRRNGLPPVTP